MFILRITTWITFLESWYREASTKSVLKVVVRIYSKIILGIITRNAMRIVTRIATEMFQQGLSLDSFKNSFVGDFATPSHNPSPELLATRPSVILWIALWYNSRYNFKEWINNKTMKRNPWKGIHEKESMKRNPWKGIHETI